jgi:RimJ/RimL family protein N-acetyltransferase
MTDPSDALTSFQQALLDGDINLQPGELHADLFVHLDHPNGEPRLTYARVDRRKVIALAIMVGVEPVNGLPCFQAGVAVAEVYRGKGYAKSIVTAAIDELKNGLARNKISSFYVEAVVSIDNEPSKKVAEATISPSSAAITDECSGLPALHYVRKIS